MLRGFAPPLFARAHWGAVVQYGDRLREISAGAVSFYLSGVMQLDGRARGPLRNRGRAAKLRRNTAEHQRCRRTLLHVAAGQQRRGSPTHR